MKKFTVTATLTTTMTITKTVEANSLQEATIEVIDAKNYKDGKSTQQLKTTSK